MAFRDFVGNHPILSVLGGLFGIGFLATQFNPDTPSTGGGGGDGGQINLSTDRLQNAYNYAERGLFPQAVDELYLIPKKHKSFAKAQVKIKEYKAKNAAKERAIAYRERVAKKEEHQRAVRENPESFLEVKGGKWHTGVIGAMAYGTVTIKNTSQVPIGDIKLLVTFQGESGTTVGNDTYTVNRIIAPGQTRTFNELPLAAVPDEAVSMNVVIADAVPR